jgi:hypothetical protein
MIYMIRIIGPPKDLFFDNWTVASINYSEENNPHLPPREQSEI